MLSKTIRVRSGDNEAAGRQGRTTLRRLPDRLLHPVMSQPDDWCAFNDQYVHPWQVSRTEAAAFLRRIRSLARNGDAVLRTDAPGRYQMNTFNTVVLTTRAWTAETLPSVPPSIATSPKRRGAPYELGR